MQNKLRIFFINYWPAIILGLIASLLCILNFTPGTWLSGWDTLHPEFNFGLNLSRLINGVFRTEQGLGAVAAHSHMADLPRVLFLYLEHFLLPLNLLRYSWIFLNLIVGPIGMYLFLNKYVLKNKFAAFLGGLFYLLNFGTAQIFNVPFEMFTTQYAFLPFVFYTATKFLNEQKNTAKNLLWFSIVMLLIAPSAYAATLWYAFFAIFIIYFSLYWFFNARRQNAWVRIITLFLLSIGINLFWIAPNIYFLLNHAKEVQGANINLLFSDSAFLKNKEFGSLTSLLTLKTFYFDWSIYSGKEFVPLLNPFIQFFNRLGVLTFIPSLLWVLGLLSLIKIKKASILIFLIPFFIAAFFMINDNLPTGPIYNLLQNNIPFFKEAFRFPQDKFLGIYIFFVSIFFSYFALWVSEKLKNRNLKLFAVAALSAILLFSALPSFQGNLINKFLRVNIPNYYFRLFDYLNTQDKNVKVANLPINSQWGWVYYKWAGQEHAFQGAGFLYFGIPQPLLDRDFDRWSPYNEQYYREMSYAVYKRDAGLLKNVLQKYNVGFVFIDRSITDPSHPSSSLFDKESEETLLQTGMVEQQKDFGEIKLFKIKNTKALAFKLKNPQTVSPTIKTQYLDTAFAKLGDYINGDSYYFPFRQFIDNLSKLASPGTTEAQDYIKFSLTKPSDVSNLRLLKEGQTPADLILERQNQNLIISIYPNTPVFDDVATSLPIKQTFDVDNYSSSFLSINSKQVFGLKDLPEKTPLLSGKIILDKQNSASLFDSSKATTIQNVSQIINPFFNSCEQNAAPSANIFGNSYTIKGYGNICVLVPFGFFPEISKYQLVNFGFEYKGDAKVTSCLFDQNTSSCTYYLSPQTEGKLLTFSYVLAPSSANHMAIKLFFNKDQANNFELKNFYASAAQSNNSFAFSSDTILKSNNLSLTKNIFVPKNSLNAQTNLAENTENGCKSISGEADSVKNVDNSSGKPVVSYNSKSTSFCDHFSFPNLSHNLAYLVEINSKNKAGLPLTLCITNYTSRRCDIYTSLGVNKEFKNETFVLPPSDENGVGYDVNVENAGIPGSPAVNSISSINFYPIPYDFLKNLSIKQNNKTAGIVFEYGYDYEPGFHAYLIKNNSLLENALPFVFGQELKQHVVVNNWANGWILPKNIDGKNVLVVFLPQYLEFLGLGLIGLIFLILCYKLKVK